MRRRLGPGLTAAVELAWSLLPAEATDALGRFIREVRAVPETPGEGRSAVALDDSSGTFRTVVELEVELGEESREIVAAVVLYALA